MRKAIKYLFNILLLCYSSIALGNPTLEDESIYQLHVDLIDQSGKQIELDVYRGHPVLITMFYAHCPYVCPLIINTLQRTESELTFDQRHQLRVLLVSLDPERDTVHQLADAARKQNVDTSRWILARANTTDVRRLAAVLGIRFRKLPDGEFNHTTLITLLDEKGMPVTNSNQLSKTDSELLGQIQKLTRQ